MGRRLERHLDDQLIGAMRAAIKADRLTLQDHSHSVGRACAMDTAKAPPVLRKWPDRIHAKFNRLEKKNPYWSRRRLRAAARDVAA
jgi:hypothetical protein